MAPRLILGAAVVALLAGCGGSESDTPTPPVLSSSIPPSSTSTSAAESPAATSSVTGGCADVVDGSLDLSDDGTYRVTATVSSTDTGEDKYADAWEVRAPDGEVVATRELLHPHVDEQPFTRTLAGVEVPAGIETVVLAAHDTAEGFCGETLEVAVP